MGVKKNIEKKVKGFLFFSVVCYMVAAKKKDENMTHEPDCVETQSRYE